MNTIKEYIETFEPEIQKVLNEIRNFIKAEVPEATEKISYGMPTFYLNGNLVHFAAFKDHYGFFPSPSGIDAFEKELAPYRSGKGTLRFSIEKPIPFARSLRYAPFPRSLQTHLGGTKPYGFLYGAAQTSQTAGTLCEMGTKII